MEWNLLHKDILEFPQMWLLLLASVIKLFWLFYVYLRESRFSKIMVGIFAAFTICSLFWALTNAYFNSPFLLIYSEDIAIIIAIISNITSCSAAIIFYYISCLLLSNTNCFFVYMEDFKISIYSRVFIYTVCIGNIGLNIVPGLTVKGVDIIDQHGFNLIHGPFASLYFLLAVAPIVPLIRNLIVSTIRLQGSRTLVGTYMLLGALIIYFTAIATNVIAPLFFHYYKLTWLPPFINCITISLVGYTMSRVWLSEPIYFFKNVLKYAFWGLIFCFSLFGIKSIWDGICDGNVIYRLFN